MGTTGRGDRSAMIATTGEVLASMPVYEFRCADCATTTDVLAPLGDTAPRDCPECGGQMRHRISRVAVKYQSWGFSSTDRLVSDRPGGRHDFKELRERAERISDE